MAFVWKENKPIFDEKLGKCLQSLSQKFNTLRTDGANPMLLDRVLVPKGKKQVPIQQVCRINVNGPSQLVIESFEKETIPEITKAIQAANLGFNPTVDNSGLIRINIPPLTEERRKELAKQLKGLTENGKIAARNIRREYNDKIKAAEKAKEISKDESKKSQVSCSYYC